MTPTDRTASEMPRPVRLDRLARQPQPFDETATPEERAAIAALLGARSVDRFRFRGRLVPLGDAGWALEGRLTATVVQACGLTLEDVTQRMDEAVARRYLPGAAEASLDLDPEGEEEDEPLPRSLDLGAVAVEAAALALDPWPRKPGASLPDPATDAGEKPNPFAALAALRPPKNDR